MKRRELAVWMTVLGVAAGVAGCAGKTVDSGMTKAVKADQAEMMVTEETDDSETKQEETENLAEGKEPSWISFTDALNRDVKVSNPKRVAALLGSYADIWYLAGGEVCASADDAWDDFDLPLGEDVINLGMTKELSLEKLFEANPDLVLASSNTQGNVELLDTLEAANIPVAYFDVSNFGDYLYMLRVCTGITGRKDLYEKYGTDVLDQIDAVTEKSKERIKADGEAPTVLSLRASSTYIRAKNSKKNVLGEMLAGLGCINIADSDESLLENLSVEHIIEQDPDYIFFVQSGDDAEGTKANIERFIAENPAWSELTAVKEGRVHLMDKQLYNLKPNARWGEAYEKLEEIFADE